MRLGIVVLASIIVLGSSAYADDETKAKALFKQGVEALDDANYVDAVELFNAAYELSPNPKALLNLGTAYKALGRYAEAADSYERYLADPAADKKQFKEVEKVLAELESKVGILDLDVSEADVVIKIDGEEVGRWPELASVRLDPGTHAVVGEKEGFDVAASSVTIKAGEHQTLSLVLAAVDVVEETPVGTGEPEEPGGGETEVAVVDPDGPDGDGSSVVPGVTARATPRSSPYGALARLDFDPGHAGMIVAVGAALRVSRVDIVAAALVGPVFGGWAGGRLYVTTGRIRPVVTIGAPILATDDDGLQIGIHGAAGVELDLGRVGVFVDVGVQHFPGASEGKPATLFLPSLGAQIRL